MILGPAPSHLAVRPDRACPSASSGATPTVEVPPARRGVALIRTQGGALAPTESRSCRRRAYYGRMVTGAGQAAPRTHLSGPTSSVSTFAECVFWTGVAEPMPDAAAPSYRQRHAGRPLTEPPSLTRGRPAGFYGEEMTCE